MISIQRPTVCWVPTISLLNYKPMGLFLAYEFNEWNLFIRDNLNEHLCQLQSFKLYKSKRFVLCLLYSSSKYYLFCIFYFDHCKNTFRETEILQKKTKQMKWLKKLYFKSCREMHLKIWNREKRRLIGCFICKNNFLQLKCNIK